MAPDEVMTIPGVGQAIPAVNPEGQGWQWFTQKCLLLP